MKIQLQQHQPIDEYHLEISFDKDRHVNFDTSAFGKSITVFDCTKAELAQAILDLSNILTQIKTNSDLTFRIIRSKGQVKVSNNEVS